MSHFPGHVDPTIVNPRAMSVLPLWPDEQELFAARYHPIILIVRLVMVGVAVAALVLGGRIADLEGLPRALAAIVTFGPWVVGGMLALIYILNFRLTEFLATTRRAQARGGVIGFKELNIPLEQVNDIETFVGFWGRIFNFGNIRLASGNSILVVSFAGIPQAKARADQLEAVVASLRN